MRAILGKLAYQRSIGLYVNDQEVTVCVLGSTPFGRVEIHRERETLDGRPLRDVIARHLHRWAGTNRRVRMPVALGVPQRMIFHGSHAVTNTNKNASPESILEGLLKSPSVKVDEMLIDLRQTQIGRRPIARIAACRRKNIEPLLGVLNEQGARLRLAEPEACSLVRLAEKSLRSNLRDEFTLRVFLGESRALAVLQHRRSPVSWKEFDVRPGEEPADILAALNYLKTSSKHLLGGGSPDCLIVHGRTDLRAAIEAPELLAQAGVKFVQHGVEPALNSESVALGLAMSANEDDPELDLIRRAKPLDRVAEIFPWSEVVLQLVLLAAVWLTVDGSYRSVTADRDVLQAKLAGIGWLKTQQEPELSKELTALDLKLKSIDGFVSTHTDWSTVLRSVGGQMSEKLILEQFAGQNEIQLVGKSTSIRVAKSIVMRFQTALDASKHVPKEVDEFVSSLRSLPAIAGEFPNMDIVDLKTMQGTQTSGPAAMFSIICAPKQKKSVMAGEAPG